jgi:hypothetical protein
MSVRVVILVHCLIGAICLLPIPASAADTQVKKTPFGTGAEVGFGLVKYRKTCIWFRVVFISGDFFKDLQEHKTHNGIEFRKRKGKMKYVSFPEQLVVDLEAIPQKCNWEIPPLDYAAGLMEKPSFKVAWKRGDESRPVELLATEEHHNQLGWGWSYLLTVPSATVPLTDSLVIDVSMRDGTCRTRLTANLDDRQRPLIPSTCDWKTEGKVQ